jgi:hypothetical protein
MAAAASSLKSQAQELVQVVAVFKLSPSGAKNGNSTPQIAHRPKTQLAAPKKAALPRPASPKPAVAKPPATPQKPLAIAAKAPAKAAPAGGEDEWETF